MPYLMPWGLKEVRSDMANYAGNVRSSATDQTDRLICPKPQRVPAALRPAQPSPSSSSSFRLWRSLSPAAAAASSASAADGNSEAPGHEILEIFLSKASPVTSSTTDSYGYGYGYGASPPYFAGSPPSRAGNPLVRDSTFVHLTSCCSPASGSSFSSIKPNSSTTGSGKVAIAKSSKSSTTVRASSPSIRIEGFDCTGRDTRRRVSAFA